MLGAWTFRGKKNRIKEGLANIYEIFPIMYEKRDHKAEFLSGGEAKILSIAKEMISSPDLLLVDEPSAGLAPKAAAEVLDLARSLTGEGVSILLVEQNVTKTLAITDRGYVLENGRIARPAAKTVQAIAHALDIPQDGADQSFLEIGADHLGGPDDGFP